MFLRIFATRKPFTLIQVHDKQFELFISRRRIQHAVKRIANRITADFNGQQPVLMPVLNGAFIFAADLMRAVNTDCEVSFIKATSYEGTQSTGNLNIQLHIEPEYLCNKPLILIEDIIDTGYTIARLIPILSEYKPLSIKVACLLHKPDALLYPDLHIDYVGIKIENKFVVGYGLDYNGLGRNYPDIYRLLEQP